MARVSSRLTDLALRQAKPDPEGKKTLVLPDGNGLRLTITPGGRKFWQYRTAVGGTERTAQIGEYPSMTLDAARQRTAELMDFGRQGRNPVAEHKANKLRNRIKAITTFEAVATELLVGKKQNVSAAHYKKVSGALKANLYPVIGSLPIQEITPPMLREALRGLEKRGALDYLAGIRRWAGEVFDYAKAHGHYLGDNPAHALRKNVFKKHEGGHMKALAWADVGAFAKGLDSLNAERPTACAVQLLLLTACRPSEVREAKWSEFDFDRARWEIPAERMKKREMHAVPLSRQAMAVLEELKKITGEGEYLFPSRGGSKQPCISDMTLLYAVKRAAGKEVHAHGLRATFSTHVSESLKWDDKVKEAALAHRKAGKTEASYDRATHYVERMKLMQWYADEIDAAVKGADVIPINGKSAAG
jgi:integrase